MNLSLSLARAFPPLPKVLLCVSLICAPLSADAFSLTQSPAQVPVMMLKPLIKVRPVRRYTSAKILLHLSEDDNDLVDASVSPTLYTPIDRPLLAIVDTVGLTIFALIGKSSHSSDGPVDLVGVFSTAFPFITAWLATSPITGIYSPDERGGDTNMATSTAIKVAKGWAVAIPLGIVLRGLLKGYAPPLPFVVVTLITTLAILAATRVLFNIVENLFVELI
ncbi:hypothetical protein HJC23_001671 [Cyclotella cryptica]|uniref:Uncharacterized protein n=1 Tax=Cyclotella cryptica TaxID=29204 RepID=A0ABD3QLH5_9STRA|eukprot:CCRYP_004704-RA/>CCRYP_004704-RA protein AED:0.00 eAED:0.00 QI:97/-1/1/1/-1/1/1/25/220